MKILRRGAASLFVLALPKAAFAAEPKLVTLIPSLTVPPLAQPSRAYFSGFSLAPKEFEWLGALAFGPRKHLGAHVFPAAAYDDRRMLCGRYCVPTFEMDRASAVARRVLFGVGAVSIGTGLVFALASPNEARRGLAPSFRFGMGRRRLSMAALWSF